MLKQGFRYLVQGIFVGRTEPYSVSFLFVICFYCFFKYPINAYSNNIVYGFRRVILALWGLRERNLQNLSVSDANLTQPSLLALERVGFAREQIKAVARSSHLNCSLQWKDVCVLARLKLNVVTAVFNKGFHLYFFVKSSLNLACIGKANSSIFKQ